MIPVQDVTDLDVVFPGNVEALMPKWEDIPKEFRGWRATKWNGVFNDWFYAGLRNASWMPKDGVDTAKALRHIKAIMGSWNPKHEHKEAAVAYLLSEWFEDVKYEKGEALDAR